MGSGNIRKTGFEINMGKENLYMVNLGAFRAELERRGFKTSYFDTAGQASDYLDQALDGRTCLLYTSRAHETDSYLV